MAYPILAAGSTWYKGTAARSTITQINIADSYTPTGNETESWNADSGNAGSIKCYRTGTVLAIVGNGSGKIAMNANSSFVFSDSNKKDWFRALTTINGAEILDSSNATTFNRIFQYCDKLTYVNVSNWDTSSVTTMAGAFQLVSSLKTIDLSNWDVSNVTDMSFMFNMCYALSTLDVSKWDVSKVTNMDTMFQECQSLLPIDVSNWDVSNVTDMRFMFYNDKKIGTLDLSKWNVSKVETFHHFTAHANMTLIGVENWNVSNCRAFNAIFHTCRNTSLDLSKWNVSKGVTFAQMFEYSSKLVEIKGLENWDTSNGKDFAEMFNGCSSLKELDLSSFDTRNASTSWTDEWNTQKGNMKDMFLDMNKLEKITFGENFSFKGNGSCTAAVLPTPSSTYINGADGNWYDLDGIAYAPTTISNGANTYYASIDVIDIVYLIKHATLIKLAKAVRSLTGSTEKMTLDEMKTALENLV